MTHYRTKSESERVTLAYDPDEQEDVLIHVECAQRNLQMEVYGGDYTYEDGDVCAVCVQELAHTPQHPA